MIESIQEFRKKLAVIIFGTNTRGGRLFDLVLVYVIILSVLAVTLESVESIGKRFVLYFMVFEWVVTILFTFEYIARVWVLDKPFKYIFSFYGFVDFLSTVPSYLQFFVPGANTLVVIRMFRVLRIFRILRMVHFLNEAQFILKALQSSLYKIIVFLSAVMTLVTIVGTLMYLVEGNQSGFDSIPSGIYWSIVTVSTVGFGDITPVTVLGKILASLLMLTGYALIAVPTGLVTAEMIKTKSEKPPLHCAVCNYKEEDPKAKFCRMCGGELER